MVLSNLARLLDVAPPEFTDRFWVAYTGGCDWVVEPTILGMGICAVGQLMTTKPYVSDAPYISKVSNYLNRCQFKPRTDCLFTNLQWSFLGRHRVLQKDNPRLRIPINSLQKRTEELQRYDNVVYRTVQDRLLSGKPMSPESVP